MLERDMQNLVRQFPAELLGESGLVFQGEEVRMGDFRFDLVFVDRQGATLLVELQRGRLDRTHLYKVLDYADRYREANPGAAVECMVVANEISAEYKDRLQARGVDYREISLNKFAEFGRIKGYVAVGDGVAVAGSATATSAPISSPADSGVTPRPPSANRSPQMHSSPHSVVADPQRALKREFLADPAMFISKSEFERRYGRKLMLWDRNFYDAMGFPLPAKVTADDRNAASAKVIAKVRGEGSMVTRIPLRPGLGLKVTLDDSFPFSASQWQIGFALTCLVFGWLDDTKGKLADLGVSTHHFYDLERKYQDGTAHVVVSGLIVESIRD